MPHLLSAVRLFLTERLFPFQSVYRIFAYNVNMDTEFRDVARKPTKRSLWKIFVGLFVLLLIGLAIAYWQTRQRLLASLTPDGQLAYAEKEAGQVLSELSLLAILPNEEPVVATVVGAETLRSESDFYRDAQDGDKLVMFPQAERVYLYRPGLRRLVNVGPLTLEGEAGGVDDRQAAPTLTPEQRAATNIEVWNGTPTAGEANRVRDLLREQGYIVMQTGNTQADYTQNQIILLGGAEYQTVADILTTQLQGVQSTGIPAGENSSTADILIILGVPNSSL